MILKRFGWIDAIIIISLISGIFYSIPSLTNLRPSLVTVYRDAKIIAEYPLTENKTFSVQGNQGEVIISIKDKSVSIKKSTCRHQLCVRSGAISRVHGQVICAPNHILVLINSQHRKQTDIDAIAR